MVVSNCYGTIDVAIKDHVERMQKYFITEGIILNTLKLTQEHVETTLKMGNILKIKYHVIIAMHVINVL